MPKGICYNASRQERRKCSLWHAKSPGGRNSGAFLFRCGKVAYSLGWLPPIYLRPAICRCSRRLHLPRQRVRKTKIYSWWHTPFLYLYRGGSVAHYTIVAEMPQEAILQQMSFLSPAHASPVPSSARCTVPLSLYQNNIAVISKINCSLSVRRKRCKNVLIRLAVKARGSEV